MPPSAAEQQLDPAIEIMEAWARATIAAELDITAMHAAKSSAQTRGGGMQVSNWAPIPPHKTNQKKQEGKKGGGELCS